MTATHRTSPTVLEPDAIERESAGFDLQMRGYSREQVEQRIAEWATAYDAVELERDQLLAEVSDLRDRPQQLTPLESMSARVLQIVTAAEQEAAQLRETARQEVGALLADAQETAEADRSAAASERTVAAGEAQRWVTEGREQAKRLVDEATEEAERLRAEAAAEAAELVSRATAEAAQIRGVVAAEEEQILSSARLDAAELERTTTRQREIAEAEHQRLLAAHASQQKQYAASLRAELQELQSRRDEAEGELNRLRQLLALPAPARASAEPPVVAPTAVAARRPAAEPIAAEPIAPIAAGPLDPGPLDAAPIPAPPVVPGRPRGRRFAATPFTEPVLPATAVEDVPAVGVLDDDPRTEFVDFFAADAPAVGASSDEPYVGEATPVFASTPAPRGRTGRTSRAGRRDALGMLSRDDKPADEPGAED